MTRNEAYAQLRTQIDVGLSDIENVIPPDEGAVLTRLLMTALASIEELRCSGLMGSTDVICEIAELSEQVKIAFRYAHVETVTDLLAYTEAELATIPTLEESGVQEVKDFLATRGLSLLEQGQDIEVLNLSPDLERELRGYHSFWIRSGINTVERLLCTPYFIFQPKKETEIRQALSAHGAVWAK